MDFNNRLIIAYGTMTSSSYTYPITFTHNPCVACSSKINLSNNVNATCGWVSGLAGMPTIGKSSCSKNGDSKSINIGMSLVLVGY